MGVYYIIISRDYVMGLYYKVYDRILLRDHMTELYHGIILLWDYIKGLIYGIMWWHDITEGLHITGYSTADT